MRLLGSTAFRRQATAAAHARSPVRPGPAVPRAYAMKHPPRMGRSLDGSPGVGGQYARGPAGEPTLELYELLVALRPSPIGWHSKILADAHGRPGSRALVMATLGCVKGDRVEGPR